MATYSLYTTALSPFGQRASIALHLKALSEHTRYIDTFGGTDTVKALSPLGQIPILDGPDGVLPESQTIVDYLDRKYPAPPLRSLNANIGARQNLISRMVDLYLAPHILQLIIAMRGQLAERTVERAIIGAKRGLEVIEPYLLGDPYAIGDKISVADLALGPFLFYVPRLANWHQAGHNSVNNAKSTGFA